MRGGSDGEIHGNRVSGTFDNPGACTGDLLPWDNLLKTGI